MVIVLIGPMGCGKTTIGEKLAAQLNCEFDDADDFHPPENVEKMRAGIPLDDHDREGWLVLLAARIHERLKRKERLVLACSALKKSYRDILGINQKDVLSVYLKGSFELLSERIGQRKHRYMNKGLLNSQLQAMEEPDDGLVVDIAGTPDEIVRDIISKLEKMENME